MKLSRIIFVLTLLLLLGGMASDAQAGFVFSNSTSDLQSRVEQVSGMAATSNPRVESERNNDLDLLLWIEHASEKYAWGNYGTTSSTSSSVTQSQTSNVPAASLAETPRTTGSLITKITEEPIPQSRYMPTSLFRPPKA